MRIGRYIFEDTGYSINIAVINFNDFANHQEKEVDDGRDKDGGLFK